MCLKCNKVYNVPSLHLYCSLYFSNCCSPREEEVDTDSNSRPLLITYWILRSYCSPLSPRAFICKTELLVSALEVTEE